VLLAIGGLGEGRVHLRAVERYDPATNRWTVATSMDLPCIFAYGALLRDGRVAVSGVASSGVVQVYAPSTNTWTRLPSAGAVGDFGFAVTHEFEGYLYAIAFGTSTVYRYNLMTGEWSVRARYEGRPAFSHVSTIVTDAEGRIHVFSGEDPLLHALYSPISNTWTTGPRSRSWPYNFAAVRGLDGRIYVSGGYVVATDGSSRVIADLQVLDLATDTLTPLAPMPLVRSSHGTALLPGGRILAAGGEYGTMVPRLETMIYTIATNTWR
jgi:N-acetylneuraminic acid mutarotase